MILEFTIATCPHCEGRGKTKRGRKCRHCLGHGGFRVEPQRNARAAVNRFAMEALIKRERTATLEARGDAEGLPALPVTVLLIRVAPNELDNDNVSEGFKAVRDEIADWYGITDRDKRIRFRYSQSKPGTPRTYFAVVQIHAGQRDCAECGQPVLP